MAGPVLFGGGLVALTAAQWEFTLSLGWRPLEDPAGAWPSGLALGPYGWLQDANFIVSGILLAAFAAGLHRGLPGSSRTGPALLFTSGIAMSLLAFETDPIDRTGPRSVPGAIHDAAFVLLAGSLLAALVLLWRRMRRHLPWRGHARYTLATALLTAACLALGGPAYYGFVAAFLAWFEVTALKLRREGRSHAERFRRPRT